MPRRFIWFAIGLVVTMTILGWLSDPASNWQFVAVFIGQTLMIGLALAAFVVAAARSVPRPASFEGGQERQVALASPALHASLGGQILMLGFLAALANRAWSEEDTAYAVVITSITGLLTILVGWRAFGVLRGLPQLEITPQALVVRDPLGWRRFPWQALSPTAPVRHISHDRLTLNVTDSRLVQRRGLVRKPSEVDLSLIALHPQFLAESIHSRVAQAQSRQTS